MRIVFFGSPEFAVPSLEAVVAAHQVVLVLSQPDRPAGRGRALQPPPVKQRALQLGLLVEQPTKLREPVVADRLRAARADAFVVVAYGRILPPALLEIPRLGPWNVHGSQLPKYRGAAPIQWAVMRGEQETGVCIMRMEEGLDTGPVVACRSERIAADDTAGTLSIRLAKLGAQLLTETLPTIERGEIQLQRQDHSRATMAPMLRKEDGLLDFRAPARLVSAQARGVDPWPGAYGRLGDEVLKLFSPRVVAEQEVAGQPGQVLGLDRTDEQAGLRIACGEGAVCFAELQLPGRKRLPAAAVLAGHPIPTGTMLGGKV